MAGLVLACAGHPRLAKLNKKDVDARDKRGHDAER
jgi:tRNA-binding EMAP/Myf-like protein